jgi:hypothetical protein
MKKTFDILYFSLVILIGITLLPACTTLTKKPAPVPIKKIEGNLYEHKSPAFSIIYPLSWKEGKPDGKSFFKVEGGMMGIPSMNIASQEMVQSPEDAGKALCKEISIVGKNCQIVYAKEITLSDGTPAFETQAKWDHPFMPGVNTCSIVAKKGDTCIGVALTDVEQIKEEYKQYMYSLIIK